ncbi:UNKNOWN [Stylonychia lemnae]|uniref:Uncharacterized protein n=1 Tax=Stylonychia lemnae TaxID=5949 RepID=A0A078ADQ1_STYLE|nr:UNKNOWN [Stylonychia lemnae]|eukprot:CDW80354.1 UNKNOWN [Stylonychia lemnae]
MSDNLNSPIYESKQTCQFGSSSMRNTQSSINPGESKATSTAAIGISTCNSNITTARSKLNNSCIGISRSGVGMYVGGMANVGASDSYRFQNSMLSQITLQNYKRQVFKLNAPNLTEFLDVNFHKKSAPTAPTSRSHHQNSINRSVTNQLPKLPEKLTHSGYQKKKFSRIKVKDSSNGFVISGSKIQENPASNITLDQFTGVSAFIPY